MSAPTPREPSRPSRRRPEGRPSARRRLIPRADALESRRLLTYTATQSGSVFFQGDGADDTIIFEAVNGQLKHNRFTAGDPGFNSDFDFDSLSPGDQTLPASTTQSVFVDMGGGSDTARIGTAANPANLIDNSFSIVGGIGGPNDVDSLIVDDASGPRDASGSHSYAVNGNGIAISGATSTLRVTYSGLDQGRLLTKQGTPAPDVINQNRVDVGGNDPLTPIQIQGGAIRDTLLFAENTTFTGSYAGGDGRLDYSNFLGAVSVNLMTGVADNFSGTFTGIREVAGGSGNDTLVAGPLATFLLGQAGNDILTGGPGNDGITGGPGDDTIDGQGGDDNIAPGGGLDSVTGGAGFDTIFIDSFGGSGGSNVRIDGANVLTTTGTLSNDGTISFPAGVDVELVQVNLVSSGIPSDDTLIVTTGLLIPFLALGNDGNDTLDFSGFAGAATLDGGDGDDTLIGSTGPTGFFPGTGTDSVVITGSAGDDDIRLSGTGGGTLRRNGVDSPIDLLQTDRLSFNGGAGSDTLTVDLVAGVPFPTSGFTYDGGLGGNDSLNIVGVSTDGPLGTVTYTPSSIPGSGVYNLDGLRILFSNLEPINDTAPADNFVFNGPSGSQSYQIVNGPTVNGLATIQFASTAVPAAFELVNFANKANVVFNAGSDGSGNSLLVNIPQAAAGLANLAVNSGDGTDLVSVTATPATGTYIFNLGAGDDTINVAAAGLGNSGVSVDGGLGFDTLNFNTNGQAAVGTPNTLSFFGRTLTYANFEIINALTLEVLNTGDGGFGSLRQAILNANAIAGPNTITFAIPGSGPFAIFPDTPLPDITQTVVIDGYSQPGATPNTAAIGTNAVIQIQLQGSGQPSGGFAGLTVTGAFASGTVIQGLAIGRFDTGIVVRDFAAGVRILGNFLGADASGVASLPNNLDGILIAGTDTAVGTPALADRNLISANLRYGIEVTGSSPTIANNLIGSDRSGLASLGNQIAGVSVDTGAIAATIGGSAAGSANVLSGNIDGILIQSGGTVVVGNRIGLSADGTKALSNTNGIRIVNGGRDSLIENNLISGNTSDGLFLVNSNVTGNRIVNNRIGTDGAGSRAIPNGRYGVELALGTANNRVERNVISGNAIAGVRITDPLTTGNGVSGNRIGTDASGTAAIPNGLGISVEGATNNTIGTLGAVGGNLISGNSSSGIVFLNGADRNFVLGNIIGLNAAGTAALPNAGNGIGLQLGGEPGQTIGGTSASERNVISGNGGAGIVLDGGSEVVGRDAILGNYIGTNAAGTAAIGNAGNGIEIVATTALTIGGTAAGAGNLISGNGQNGILGNVDGIISGVLILGNRIGTDAAGSRAIPNGEDGIAFESGTGITIGGPTAGARNLLSGNAVYGLDLAGATGSVALGNYIGTDITGTAAIPNDVNVLLSPGGNTIGGLASGAGNLISGGLSGGIEVFGISGTPNVFATSGFEILGNRIGTTANGNAALPNGGPGIQVVGTTAGLIQGNLISGNAGNGVQVSTSTGPGTAAVRILGNRIGTDAAGNARIANGGDGVSIAASGVTVGGPGSAGRNVLSGNAGAGISVGGSRNAVYNNAIGTNAAGTAALPNGASGVRLVAATSPGTNLASAGNSIGAAGLGNVISGNGSSGIELIGPTTTGNLIAGNLIGTNAAGTAALSNRSGVGILVNGAPGNVIGGEATGAGNLISGHVDSAGIGVGIRIQGTSPNQSLRTLIQGNRIGTDATGTAALPNAVAGIYIVSASGNTVGGITAGARNVISGNGSARYPGAGLWIEDSAGNNVAAGNFIGLGADGRPLGNRGVGVVISDAARNVVGPGNVISANGFSGVQVFGAAATGNAIRGNFIGTDANGGGTANANGIVPFGNGSRNAANDGEVGVGVYLDSTSGNIVGGTSAADANVISGNRTYGVQIRGGSANTVVGNRIGTDAAGAVAVPNRLDGVLINGSSNNAIVRNLISGNGDSGVQINGAASTGNSLSDNLIGVAAAGTPLVNRTFGVAVTNGATGNTLTGGVIVAAGGPSDAVFDPNGGITVNNVSASVVRMKAGKMKMTAVKIKNKKPKAAKPAKAPKPFANRPLKGLQKAHSARKS